MRRISCSVFITLLILLAFSAIGESLAADDIDSGWCGDNASWALSDTGILTISGTGEMDNYANNGVIKSAPWAAWAEEIHTVIIEPGVTSIGSASFYSGSLDHYDHLTNVTIPDSVTDIEKYAFYHCSGLTNLTLPESVTNIADDAFYGCIGLADEDGYVIVRGILFYYMGTDAELTLPEGLTGIGSCAFRYCDSLTSVIIPESVKNIGVLAFANCSNLTSIVIPKNIRNCAQRIFSFSDHLTSITMPVMHEVLSDLFNGKVPSGLETVVLTKGRITSKYFKDCSGLKNIILEDGVTRIDSDAFSGCTGLTSVTISKSVTDISTVFPGCSSLTEIIVSDENMYYSDIDGVLFDKNVHTILLYPRTRGAYTIPEGVTGIAKSAFANCLNLTGVTIPDSLTDFGEYAFSDCRSLTGVTIPEGVTTIPNSAFFCCYSLKSVTIPVSVTKIGNSAFFTGGSLTDVYYGGTIEQWNDIYISNYPWPYMQYNDNQDLLDATIYYDGVPITYTVTYDANGGDGTPDQQIKLHNKALRLSTMIPSHEDAVDGYYTVKLNTNDGNHIQFDLIADRTVNYVFKEWNTAMDGSGTGYASGADYTVNESTTLYAQWESSAAAAPVTLFTPSREGFVFQGWAATPDADAGITGSYVPTDDVVLYAVWAAPDFVLPGALTEIDDEAFVGGAFTFVKLTEKTTRIGRRAFADCPHLAYIYFPSVTTEIDPEAFANVAGLTILGQPGSTAEAYANAHNFAFVSFR